MHSLERRGIPKEDLRRDWKLIPNWISYFRIALSPVPAVILLSQSPDSPVARWITIGLFAVLSLSDGLDGFLARRFNWTSQWGKLVDPIGDKLLVAFTAVAAMVVNWSQPYGLALAVLLWVVLARELILMAQVRIARHDVPPPTLLGKAKTVVQLLLLGVLMLPQAWLTGLRLYAILIVLVVTVLSWRQYYRLYVSEGVLAS